MNSWFLNKSINYFFRVTEVFQIKNYDFPKSKQTRRSVYSEIDGE